MARVVKVRKVDCSALGTEMGTDDGLTASKEIEKGNVGFRESRRRVRGLWVNDDGHQLFPRDEGSKSPSWLAVFWVFRIGPMVLWCRPVHRNAIQAARVA